MKHKKAQQDQVLHDRMKEKELQDMKECTFNPSINSTSADESTYSTDRNIV
jgi:hypothetical protein